MQKYFLHFFLLLSILSTHFAYAADKYTLDPNHSSVTWPVSHFGFSSPSGKWFANGTLMLDEANPQNSQLNVILQMKDLDTGIPKFDEHLKSKDFFDVAQYPTATFVSNKIDVTGNSAQVQGTLTMHGVSKPLMLDVKLNKLDVNPLDHKKTAGFTAKGQLKRSDFGMTTYLPGVGDDVTLNIEAEAKLAATETKNGT